MSDYDIVKQFVIDTSYKPTYRDLDGYIVSVLLHYESYLEGEEENCENENVEYREEDAMSLKEWLDEIVKYDMGNYDYDWLKIFTKYFIKVVDKFKKVMV